MITILKGSQKSFQLLYEAEKAVFLSLIIKCYKCYMSTNTAKLLCNTDANDGLTKHVRVFAGYFRM